MSACGWRKHISSFSSFLFCFEVTCAALKVTCVASKVVAFALGLTYLVSNTTCVVRARHVWVQMGPALIRRWHVLLEIDMPCYECYTLRLESNVG